MSKFGQSQTVKRTEDLRLLTGHGRYVDDIAPEGALHAHFFRSPVAHAEIAALNLDEARAAPGVHMILTAEDIEAAGVRLDMAATVVENRDGTRGAKPKRPILAKGRVRFVGGAGGADRGRKPGTGARRRRADRVRL